MISSSRWGYSICVIFPETEFYNRRSITFSAYNIKKINVIDGTIIILYCTEKALLNGREYPEVWFVIIPSKHIETGFSSHKGYTEYLEKNGIRKEPKLYTIELADDYFEDNYPINWKSIHYSQSK
jgi:hypothetical protein